MSAKAVLSFLMTLAFIIAVLFYGMPLIYYWTNYALTYWATNFGTEVNP